ncbi:MAG: SDR family oxidoreductase [Nitrospirota bacterium]|nr:SDR family oxidoreductase [Nitrospirota bacterium]
MDEIVFLTGATGFIGGWLALWFIDKGYRLHLLVRPGKNESAEARVISFLEGLAQTDELRRKVREQVRVFAGDITEEGLGLSSTDRREALAGVKSFIHCAAVPKFVEDKEQTVYRTNLVGTENVIKVVKESEVSDFHYVSTAYVCGKRHGVMAEDDLSDDAGFHNIYEETKFLAEKKVREFAASGASTVTIYRPSIVLGHSKTGATCNFIGPYVFFSALSKCKTLFERDLARGGKMAPQLGIRREGERLFVPFKVRGLKDATNNFVPVDYVVNAIGTLFQTAAARGKTFHLTNPAPISNRKLEEYTNDIMGICGAEVVEKPSEGSGLMDFLGERFRREADIYAPYMTYEPAFDRTNIDSLLPGMTPPANDRRYFETLIGYGAGVNWGARARS